MIENQKVKPVFFSEFYGDSPEVEEEWQWFDPPLDRDTPLCIDPFQILKTNHPLFSKCKNKISSFFEFAFTLASESNRDSSKYKKLINDILVFPEVEEVCLGFSRNENIVFPREKRGRGVGGERVAKALIKLSHPPKHFEQIEISTRGIGKDSISDITANLIKRELIQYTRYVCNRILGISDESLTWCVIKNCDFDFQNYEWIDQAFYLPINPCYRIRQPVLLVPKAFLRETPSISSEQFLKFFKDTRSAILSSRNENKLELEKESESRDDILGINDEEEVQFLTDEKIANASDEAIINEINNRPHLRAKLIEKYVENVDNNPGIYTQYDFENDPEKIHFPRVVRKCIRQNPLSIASYSNTTEVHKLLKFLILKLRLFTEDREFEGFKFLWKISKKSDNLECRFQGQRSIITLLRRFIEEYCYEYDMHVIKHTDLGKEPVEFLVASPRIKDKVFLLANTVEYVSFENDSLKQILEKIDNVSHLYYIVFLSKGEHDSKIHQIIQEVETIEFSNTDFHLLFINAAQERNFRTDQLEGRYILKEEREVYISYSRKDGKEIKDRVCEALKSRGITAIFDEKEIRYKDSLKDFMQRIGRGKSVITIVSDGYFKSKYCMKELLEIESNGNFEKRVFPLVLSNANIYDDKKIADYVDFWKNKLDEKYKTGRITNEADIQDARLYQDIISMLDKILDKLRDFLIRPIDEHISSNFNEVIGAIEQEMSR
ncbi:toll/interleukin-1 receptor domain-containing protein [Oscillatoria sp. FACHB-1407]|uniref:toll/interleukin-1 receptor domain-containing protein n=1 Tax=Oscillatoria sp. FACHB-1407 TaxID=2692847 RepID=UPI0016883372|nr:toll/interleukin-1 receptor domain-containing protein [Oscillatoria sp. FACHB-1407]MBD2461349.1 toll/interleukin-1 receptor domain-containing protein [Oscillatoria sp. FACHB-1407]